MDNKYDLTQGPIPRKLLMIALPIVSTQVMQMTYSLTDMFWLGRVGSDAVASSGTAGLFMWLSVRANGSVVPSGALAEPHLASPSLCHRNQRQRSSYCVGSP